MAESYPSPHDRSTPAPPPLPAPHDDRFQFSLKQLLAFMLASAVLAAGLRYVLQWIERLPQHHLTGLQNTLFLGLLFGGLLYFFFRAPFLAIGGARALRHWRAVQRHRQELTTWADERRRQGQSRAVEPDAADDADALP